MMTDSGKRIYIIDDDESVCRALARFVRTAGYRPITSNSGKEFLKRRYLDLNAIVICDLRMPEMNGIDVFQMLKNRNIKLPFVFVTAVDDDIIVDQAKIIGQAFFHKPVDGQELLDVLAGM